MAAVSKVNMIFHFQGLRCGLFCSFGIVPNNNNSSSLQLLSNKRQALSFFLLLSFRCFRNWIPRRKKIRALRSWGKMCIDISCQSVNAHDNYYSISLCSKCSAFGVHSSAPLVSFSVGRRDELALAGFNQMRHNSAVL